MSYAGGIPKHERPEEPLSSRYAEWVTKPVWPLVLQRFRWMGPVLKLMAEDGRTLRRLWKGRGN